MNESDWGQGLPLGLLMDDCRNQDVGPFDHDSLNAMLLICGADETSKVSSVSLKRESSTTTPATAPARSAQDASSESDTEDKRAKGGDGPGSSKRGRESGMSKACREKARREKINDRFLELAKLIDPSTTDPKIDKATVLCDAIKYVQQQTVENHQLRQLNKFLEERVSAVEREKGQHMYQMSMQPNPHMLPPTPHMMTPHTMLVTVPHGMAFSLGGASTSGGMLHPHNPMMPHPMMPHASSMPQLTADPQQQLQPQQQHHHHQHMSAEQQQQHGMPGMPRYSESSVAGLPRYSEGSMQSQQQHHPMHPQQQQLQPHQQPHQQHQQVLHTQPPQPQHHQALQPHQQALQSQPPQQSPQQQQQMVLPGPQYSYHHPMLGKPAMGGQQPALGLPAGGYWLPPQMIDSVHDSMMRPPAA